MSELSDHVESAVLIDHHVHGCWAADLDTQAGDRVRFESALTEADTDPVTEVGAGFDSQVGFAVRAHCARLLDLERHVGADEYLARRTALGEAEVSRRFLQAAGVSDWLVDTGFAAGLVDTDEMTAVSGGSTHEVVRLEEVAEQAAAAPGDYAEAFDEILAERAAGAVATKSVLAYRGGFPGDLGDPPPALVDIAAQRWRDAGGTRLTDRILLRFGLHRALRLGKPLQFHVGFGDRDCDLHAANPLLLNDFLRMSGDTPIMLLHCYPYEREAGYLAQAHQNVYLDGGLSITHLGARATPFVGRLLELAPFRKILYSSDGAGPAEFHHLGARLWRTAMTRVLEGFVADDEWSAADARRVVDLIASENARRVYRL
ncbi:amidohydrolase family protein [Williamsia sp.]|uniref:amidohydrolase family protein n=1 Tax=Williamsia sp. TaxID=1872085 RepID=UPI001A1D3DA1|nr:amidohydrolase family protein [Williamsia sp.]MBJ7287829.1 amidohydrolase family protein [Williamsia sp.]